MKTFLVLISQLFLLAAADQPRIPNTGGLDTIDLTGVLHIEKHYGPPNFGENPTSDTRFTAWVLVPDCQAYVLEDKELGLEGKKDELTRVQVFLSDAQVRKSSELDGQHVRVTGTLWIATAPAEVTPITLRAHAIKTVNTSRSEQCMTIVERPIAR